MDVEDQECAERVEGVDQAGFFEIVVAMVFDVLKGVPPVKPSAGDIPAGKRG